jgi:hypothetical protein
VRPADGADCLLSVRFGGESVGGARCVHRQSQRSTVRAQVESTVYSV